MKKGVLIPVFNHGESAYRETAEILHYGYPIILVDDGSCEETKAYLKKAQGLDSSVVLTANAHNMGKGGAIITGIKKANEMGFTHILQVNADGQHDLGRIPHFFAVSGAHPEAAVIGYPVFDESVPKMKIKGRTVVNSCTHFVTCNKNSIKDALCGFRVYPVRDVCEIAAKKRLDLRMGFDIEILVRLYWRGVALISESVNVTYPEGGILHSDMVRDNIRISKMFVRLTLAMPAHIAQCIKMRNKV